MNDEGKVAVASTESQDSRTTSESKLDRRRFLRLAGAIAAGGAGYAAPSVAHAQSIANLSSQQQCRVLAFNVPTARSGCVNESDGAGKRNVGEHFQMNADFAPKCECCEYRQYVKGSFTLNGNPLPLQLPDGPLDPNNYREDGIANPPAGINQHYGHRSEGSTDPTDVYQNPNDRARGCEYRGTDFPGIKHVTTGDTYNISLTFKGNIIDVCNGGNVVRTAEWNVNCAGVA